uniref:Uncharacterized protein n=1 Tax=Rhizophora mucronata TaxID=61149 RepID=A0A2P2QXT8_RHIMU
MLKTTFLQTIKYCKQALMRSKSLEVLASFG